MKIGYARGSTDEQNLDLQRRALEAAGCEQIFEDYGVSDTAIERDGRKRSWRSVPAMRWWCESSTGSAARSAS